MLTYNEMKKLRKEIVLNSIYLDDYRNSLYITPKDACDFFDSVIDYYYNDINESMYDAAKDGNKKLYSQLKEKRDNLIDNLTIKQIYDYYKYLEYDPLLKKNYIGIISESAWSAVLVLDYITGIDDYVLTANYYKDERVEKVENIRKNKLYYYADGGAYFRKNGKIYNLNQAYRNNSL